MASSIPHPSPRGKHPETLILSLITNDDGFMDRSVPTGLEPENELEAVARHGWCMDELERTGRLAMKSRPDP